MTSYVSVGKHFVYIDGKLRFVTVRSDDWITGTVYYRNTTYNVRYLRTSNQGKNTLGFEIATWEVTGKPYNEEEEEDYT